MTTIYFKNRERNMNEQLDIKSQLINIIRQKSLTKGPVTLSSGEISDFYINLKPTLLYPKALDLISDLMLTFFEEKTSHVVGVGGLGIGALPLTTAVSLKSLTWDAPLYNLYIREKMKNYGTKQAIEGLDNVKPGDKTWILEDVVTTGKTSLTAAEKCQQVGLSVEGVLTCVDRMEGGQKNIEAKGLQFHYLLSIKDVL